MIVAPAGVKVHLALGHTDMRKGLDGLATLIQEHLKKDPFSGHLFVFRGKNAQPSTFYIRFSFRDDHVSLASAVWTNAPGVAIPAWQGFDVHLHARATGSFPRASELDVRRRLLRRHDARVA